jgi:hypothetical protein
LETTVRTRLSRQEGRRFGLTVGGAFLVVSGILLWRGHLVLAQIAGGLGGLLVLGGLVLPGRLDPVHRAWMGFAMQLSRVTTPIFMSIVYFLVLAPIGLVMRYLFRRNPLVHADHDGSYWNPRSAGNGRSDLTRQF